VIRESNTSQQQALWTYIAQEQTTVANLGELYESMGEYGKAEAFFNRALEAIERLLGPEHPDTLISVVNLGGLFKSMGEYGKAFHNRILEAHERLLGQEHPTTLITVGNFESLNKSMGLELNHGIQP